MTSAPILRQVGGEGEREVLAHAVGGVVHDGERESLGALGPRPVGGARVARGVEQPLGLGGVEPGLGDRAVGPVALHDRPVGGLARAGQRAFDEPFAVDRERQRAAHGGVAQHWVARRQCERARIRGRDLEHAIATVLAHAAGELGDDARSVDRALLEQRHARVLVRHRGQHDTLDLRRAAEVVPVGLHHDPPAGLELLDDVWAGADRPAVERGGLEVLALQRMRRGDADLELVEERRVRPVERELDGRGIDRADRLQRVQQRGQRRRGVRVEHRVVGEHDVLRGQRPAVVETDVGAQLDRDLPAVGAARRQRRREVRLRRQILGVAQKSVEELLVAFVHAVGGDRIEVLGLAGQRDHQRLVLDDALLLRRLRSTAPGCEHGESGPEQGPLAHFSRPLLHAA